MKSRRTEKKSSRLRIFLLEIKIHYSCNTYLHLYLHEPETYNINLNLICLIHIEEDRIKEYRQRDSEDDKTDDRRENIH